MFLIISNVQVKKIPTITPETLIKVTTLLFSFSAGVGRTGTFIALCNLLKEAEDTGKMNFLDTLWKLRQDRMHTIQTVVRTWNGIFLTVPLCTKSTVLMQLVKFYF